MPYNWDRVGMPKICYELLTITPRVKKFFIMNTILNLRKGSGANRLRMNDLKINLGTYLNTQLGV